MLYAACIFQASIAYHVPITAITSLFGQHPTSGIGTADIPQSWMPILERAGFSGERIESDNCTNIAAAAWIMRYELDFRSQTNAARSNQAAPKVDQKLIASTAKLDTEPGDSCIRAAAARFRLPTKLLRGVLGVEGGKVGEIHMNSNGSYDMGPAQINSIWLPQLNALGISRDLVLRNQCVNIKIGAWILAQAMAGADASKPGDFWRHVGDYNSATPSFNKAYAIAVYDEIVSK